MAAHPTAGSSSLEATSAVAHSVAIASLPLLFVGLLTLTRRLTFDALPTLALTTFAFGAVAAMFATALDGFIAPRLLSDAANPAASTGEATAALGIFTYRIIQLLTRLYVISASTAIALWSASMLRRARGRTMSVYGLLIGAALIAAVPLAGMRMSRHTVAAIVVLHAIWYVLAAIRLWRSDASTAAPG